MADPKWPDDQLIVAAQHGDVDALTALVTGSHPTVRRFARSLCATPEDAEDAAQEALLPLGVLALRGCPMCWTIGLIQTISRGRLQRSCSDGQCTLTVAG